MSSPEHVLTTPATAVGEDRGDLIGYGAPDVERFVTEAAKNP
ncbi:Deoxyguanosinetriphosphate triphosphohydrolase-like protein, partial [human gut metagenome]